MKIAPSLKQTSPTAYVGSRVVSCGSTARSVDLFPEEPTATAQVRVGIERATSLSVRLMDTNQDDGRHQYHKDHCERQLSTDVSVDQTKTTQHSVYL